MVQGAKEDFDSEAPGYIAKRVQRNSNNAIAAGIEPQRISGRQWVPQNAAALSGSACQAAPSGRDCTQR